MNLFLQLWRELVPHAVALPAVVVFRHRWGVNYATVTRFLIGWILAVPVMVLSTLALGNVKVDAALHREISRSGKFLAVFGVLSGMLFLTGRIRMALRPPGGLGLSNDIGRARLLPLGTFWQLLPSVALGVTALADWHLWKQVRPLTVMGAFYGLMMAWDFSKARRNDRAMGVAVNDAVILSGRVRPAPFPSDQEPARGGGGEGGGTAELVRIYGRSGGK